MSVKTIQRGVGLAMAAPALGAGVGAPCAVAAQAPPAKAPPPPASDLVVTGHRLPGAVVGDVKPEVTFTPEDVETFGVSTVTELLDELAPETRSDRGRGGEGPVILLNGRRISGFNEIRDIPTEAILRVEILPEEVALKYGYSADQRVVNIVLKDRFKALTVEGSGGEATEGGQQTGQGEVDLMRIRGDNRTNLDLKVQDTAALTEDQRGVIPLNTGPAGVAPIADIGRYRTLSPASKSLSVNAVLTRPVFWRMTGTVNGAFQATTSGSLLGLPDVGLLIPSGSPFSPSSSPVQLDRFVDAFGPLRQSTDGWTGHLGVALNKDFPTWRLNFTSAYDHADSLTRTDTGVDPAPLQALLDADSPSFDPFAALPAGLLVRTPQARALSRSDGLNAQVVASGPLLKVPAGSIYSSFKAGFSQNWFASSSERFGFVRSADLTRQLASGQANFDLPIASRRENVLKPLGDLYLNGNGSIQQISDFGTLKTLGYGVNWTPLAGVNLIVSRTHDQAAPTMQQLGNPVVLTPGARILDFATGETVDVTTITGGARGLLADQRDVLKIGLTVKPISTQNLVFSANYIESHIRNPIETFPAATAAIEAAFPGRFLRDPSGRLAEVDYRPVNFASEDRKELRLGFNFSKPLGAPPPQRRFDRGGRGPGGRPPFGGPADGPPPDGAPGVDAGAPPTSPDGFGGGGGPRGFGGFGGGSGRGGGGGFGRGARGPQTGQLQLALYYTVHFEDQMLVRPGGPVLDLLNGAAAGGGGGQPRHEIEAQAGILEHGLGARVSASWLSGTSVHGDGLSTSDLSFSSIAKVNLRLFANLGDQKGLMRRYPWLKGSRLTLSVNNLFDERIKVTNALGVTPLSYQPAYLDPVGRVVRLSFRKLFS